MRTASPSHPEGTRLCYQSHSHLCPLLTLEEKQSLIQSDAPSWLGDFLKRSQCSGCSGQDLGTQVTCGTSGRCRTGCPNRVPGLHEACVQVDGCWPPLSPACVRRTWWHGGSFQHCRTEAHPVKAKSLWGYGDIVWNCFVLLQKHSIFIFLIKCSCLHGCTTGVVYLFAFNI